MNYSVKILPYGKTVTAPEGKNLLELLREGGYVIDAPCGGHGTCGKCKVIVDGKEVLSCNTVINTDMTVFIPKNTTEHITTKTAQNREPINSCEDYLLAFDIGTTTVVCYLLDKNGKELATASALNPQTTYGADIVSRIQAGIDGHDAHMKELIKETMCKLIKELCDSLSIAENQIKKISVVANPAMQQLFMGINLYNLVEIPYVPVITKAETVSAKDFLPCCPNAELLIVPDISAYVGSDTLACVFATKMYEAEKNILMVDIGTNGEMVFGNSENMVACSTAAGPAFEGARIKFGMRGTTGAIDRVWSENGQIKCHVIGEGIAIGICGSGLIDAVAVALEQGLINARGKILTDDEIEGQRIIRLSDSVYLTQNDIHEVQLAKSAIASGIELMISHCGCNTAQVDEVLLAGAFGSFINPESACRIGMLPKELKGKITAVGNAAGEGAKMLVSDSNLFLSSQNLIEQIECIELATDKNFPRVFAKNILFK